MKLPNAYCTYKGAVLTSECDSNNHMNVMYYIHKFEHASRNFSHRLGVNKAFLKKHQWGIAVVQQNVQYLKECFEDDILHIFSYAVGTSKKVMSYCHQMYNMDSEVLSAVMDIKLVIFDMKKRKAIEIPDNIRSTIEEHIPSK